MTEGPRDSGTSSSRRSRPPPRPSPRVVSTSVIGTSTSRPPPRGNSVRLSCLFAPCRLCWPAFHSVLRLAPYPSQPSQPSLLSLVEVRARVAARSSFLCGIPRRLRRSNWYIALQKHRIKRTPVVGFGLLGGPNADSILVGTRRRCHDPFGLTQRMSPPYPYARRRSLYRVDTHHRH